MLYDSILDTIGNTPLVRLHHIEKMFSLPYHLYAKVESFNPSGSVKARIALMMLKEGLKQGLIDKDTVVIEATSGNTGIGLAFACSYYHLRFICIMPSSMSIERQKMIKAYGGEIVLTDAKDGMKGSLDKQEELKKSLGKVFVPSQFENMINPLTHYQTTAPEIYRDLPSITHFIAGIGTGGTISGCGKFFKEKNKDIEIIGYEPASSPLLTQGKAGSHKIQGIGANFVPKTFDKQYVDKILTVENEEAFEGMRLLASQEAIFSGISSGGALMAALKGLKNIKNGECVILLPDTGERYLSVL